MQYAEGAVYTRPITELPKALVKDGKPVFGTFAGHPMRLDIRGVKNPLGPMPLPTFITNLRIKSRLSFFFSLDEYIGCIDFFDAKIFGFAEVNFWHTGTKQRFTYRSVMGPRKRFVPHKLNAAATSSLKKSRYIRISWDRDHDRLSVIFNLAGNRVRPSANAAMIAHFSDNSCAELTSVIPSPTSRRCSACTVVALPVHGAITLVPHHEHPKTMKDTEGFAFLDINRTYMRFRTHGEFVTAFGMVGQKQVWFRIAASSQDAVDTESYNSNVLFFEGTTTPLPPVVITHPYGIMNKWIIQDTENMIDLTFTPLSESLHKLSIFVLRTQYHTIYGTFEGTLLTADGEKISFKALPGLTKKYLIRL